MNHSTEKRPHLREEITCNRLDLRVKAVLLLLLLSIVGTAGREAVFWRTASGADAGASSTESGLTLVVRTPPLLWEDFEPAAIVDRFVAAGVEEVWLQFKQDETDEFTGGTAFYPSRIAPVAEGCAVDPLADLIDALDAAGIRACAWLPTLYDPAALERHPDWQAWWIDSDGQWARQSDWLCPRNGEAIAYQAAIVREVAQRYPKLTACYIDFIRYDSDFACMCTRCLGDLDQFAGWSDEHDRPLTWRDVQSASKTRDELWQSWIHMRAESICHAIESIHDAVDDTRDDLWFGAAVLPFSTGDYSFNTQAGQDLYEMSRSGLDEIVLMGYWDDWYKSPQWLADGIVAAQDLVDQHSELSCLLDGDMSVRRTRLTLEAISDADVGLGYFHYSSWTDDELARLRRAVDAHDAGIVMPAPTFTAVVIRVDTEPDYRGRYDVVSPDMIRNLLDLLEAEGVRGTFITCAKLAEIQTDVLREAVQRGHEIGAHAYDHEQLDAMEFDHQLEVVDHSLDVFEQLSLPIVGFGAPRNSITDASRDRLIERGLLYDGSASYDPLTGFCDAGYAAHSESSDGRILVIPFIEPNDWDARRVAGRSANEMLDDWKVRLDKVVQLNEPVFVLDIHQWLAAEEGNFRAIREFIRYAQQHGDCQVMTLAEAAGHVGRYLNLFEPSSPPDGAAVSFEVHP